LVISDCRGRRTDSFRKRIPYRTPKAAGSPGGTHRYPRSGSRVPPVGRRRALVGGQRRRPGPL